MLKIRCVNPLSRNYFEELSPMEELEGVGDSCGDTCGDSSGFSVCVLVELTSVHGVTDVLVSSSSVGVLGEGSFSSSE